MNTGRCVGVSEIEDTVGNFVSDPQAICELFNNYFMDLNRNTNKPNIDNAGFCEQKVDQTMYLFPISPEEVKAIVRRVCDGKSGGVDQVPGRLVIEACEIISKPLSFLINRSFLDGIFPADLKHSKVVPVYKKNGSKNNIKNYRPIAVQCHFAKVFESAYNSRLVAYLNMNNLISPCQHGFRHGYSTETAISQALNYLHEGLNTKKKMMGLFFDLSRAFDTVDHDLLLARAEGLGIRGNAHDWLKSYLTGRTARVVIDGVESRAQLVDVGTPQGSCISPTLFTIFINNLPEMLGHLGKPVLYADDTTILVSEPTYPLLLSKADRVAHVMQGWCRVSGLELNIQKTVAVEFTVKNKTLDYSLLVKVNGKSISNLENTRFLGVHIDQKLTWQSHIHSILPKLSHCCYLLKNIRHTVSIDVLRLVYFGLFQSIISYGVIFWGGASESDQVFITQKRAVRYMCGAAPRTSCRAYFRDLQILTFPCLYIYSLIIHIKKSGYDTKRRDVHDHDTRNKNLLQGPYNRLSVTQQNPQYMGIKLFNHLTALQKSITEVKSFEVFKRQLKYFLSERCYYSVDEFLCDRVGAGWLCSRGVTSSI